MKKTLLRSSAAFEGGGYFLYSLLTFEKVATFEGASVKTENFPPPIFESD